MDLWVISVKQTDRQTQKIGQRDKWNLKKLKPKIDCPKLLLTLVYLSEGATSQLFDNLKATLQNFLSVG